MKEVNGFIVTGFRSWGLLRKNEQLEIIKRFGGFGVDCYLWKYDGDDDKWIHEA